jgi:hypothetical protein
MPCYLPHSTAPRYTCVLSPSPAILEQEGVIGQHHDGLRCWLYFMYASGALLINEGALIHWIEDLHSKLGQFPGLRPIETCEAGLKLATAHAASIMPV